MHTCRFCLHSWVSAYPILGQSQAMCYILVKSPRMAQRKFCSARSPRRSKTQPKDECQGYGAASIKSVDDDFSLLSPSKSLKNRHGRRTLICPLKSRWAYTIPSRGLSARNNVRFRAVACGPAPNVTPTPGKPPPPPPSDHSQKPATIGLCVPLQVWRIRQTGDSPP